MAFGSGVAGGRAASGGAPSVNPLPGFSQRLAGETLGGHRAVYVGDDNKFHIADPTYDLCVDMIAGITVSAYAEDDQAFVRMFGELTDPSFSFETGPVWLGPGGTLTQTRPTSGNLVLVGHSAGPDTLLVSIEFICKLSD